LAAFRNPSTIIDEAVVMDSGTRLLRSLGRNDTARDAGNFGETNSGLIPKWQFHASRL